MVDSNKERRISENPEPETEPLPNGEEGITAIQNVNKPKIWNIFNEINVLVPYKAISSKMHV